MGMGVCIETVWSEKYFFTGYISYSPFVRKWCFANSKAFVSCFSCVSRWLAKVWVALLLVFLLSVGECTGSCSGGVSSGRSADWPSLLPSWFANRWFTRSTCTTLRLQNGVLTSKYKQHWTRLVTTAT